MTGSPVQQQQPQQAQAEAQQHQDEPSMVLRYTAEAPPTSGTLRHITQETDLRQLHQSHDEYKKWEWKQFKRNTENLIKSCNDPTKKTNTPK
ncbi:expressed unknown protein [Seminavis robusta]|uniref:Uncharacterized protein n=1 Tax=Seminavis robusta TaxID=568900 RepID=A0A9N8DYA1_9STRA|nr:expressed unknown protein [Seminavis robusta]|eukprot:Sro447_g145010.1 n/a (92) ;mRNA; r:60505-60780